MSRPLGSKYTLESALGQGASGEVWQGRSQDGTRFAFKLLHDHLARDPETVRRFLQEGEILKRVDHAHVVRVHDLVADDGVLGIVMDLVEGRDLRSVLEEHGTLAPAPACTLASEVADGLAAIHAAGVVHRDIKPENVLVDEHGPRPSVRLTDFGVSRIAEQTGSRATKLVGTPAYIAPEVADGRPATAASDLYALGIMLYEMCCGVTPFQDESVLQILQKHGHHLPGRPEGVPDPLWELISGLLAKDPAERPGPAAGLTVKLAALAEDLAPVPPGSRLQEPPPTVNLIHRQLTENTQPPGPPPGADAPVAGQFLPPAPPARAARRGRGRAVAIVAGVLLVGAIIASGAVAALRPQNNDAGPVATGRPVDTGQAPRTGRPAPIPTPTTARPTYGPDQLPDLTGLSEQDARAQLPADVAVQIVRQQAPANTPDGVVLAQDPQPGSDIPASLQLTISSRQAVQYLADLTPTSGEALTTGDGTTGEGFKLSGHPQLHALGAAGNPCNPAGVTEYDLGRHYSRLEGLAGLDDSSPAANAAVTLEVFGDGVKLETITLVLGKPKQLDVDVRGVLRLGLRWEFTKGDASRCDGGTLVLGNAQLVAATGYVPDPSPSPGA